jgi:hypothetical protein
MSAFSEKYSPEQKQAVISAVLDGVEGLGGTGPNGKGEPQPGQRMTAREAQTAAANGLLPGIEPFEMNLSTIRNYAQLETRERAGNHTSRLDRKPLPEAAENLARRVIRITDKMVKRIEDRPAKARIDPRELQQVARAVREVDAMAKSLVTKRADPAPQGEAKPDSPEPLSLVAQLAQQARDTAAPSTPTSQLPETDEGEEDTGSEAPAQQPTANDTTSARESEPPVPVAADISSAPVGDLGLARAQALLRGAEAG